MPTKVLHRNTIADNLLRLGPVLLLAVVVLMALASRTGESMRLLAAYAIAFLAVQLVTQVMKRTIRQPRPKGHRERCKLVLTLPSEGATNYGMPSGHAAHSVLFLTFLVLYMRDHRQAFRSVPRVILAAVLGLFVLAVLVHRVVLKCHTASQVGVGAAVGAVIGYAAYSLSLR